MDGIILIHKERGINSFQIVKRIRKIFGIKKVGHSGTLDPEAEGLLIILLGKATKLFSDFSRLKKEYLFEIVFGKKTNTGDASGKILEEKDCSFLEVENIKKILPDFLGKIKQKPHQFSAVKINGVPAYKIARRGQKVDLKEREVEIYKIKLISFQKDTFPKAKILAEVSSGTYIRVLAEDIGKKLGVPAYCSFILRRKIGPFYLKDAIKIEDIGNRKKDVIIKLDEALKILDKK